MPWSNDKRGWFGSCQGASFLFDVTLALACAFVAGIASAQDTSTEGDNSVRSGPTVHLSYSEKPDTKNPHAAFMYFVPLISLTPVHLQTSPDNEQEVRFISYKRESNARSFEITCDFEIQGSGYHTYTFEPAPMIEVRTDQLTELETIDGVLNYITCDGAGFGRIHVEGEIEGSMETVTTVRLQFNVRGKVSPVTIGIYDVDPRNGEYIYENRSNEVVARVNQLVFERSKATPRMDISIASVAKPEKSEGLFARIRGRIANLFIKPPRIAPLGQETMLDFGDAIRRKEPEFTFPFAENLTVNGEAPAASAEP